MTTGTESWARRNHGYCVAVALAFAVYLPAIGGGPIWDDVIVFERFLPSFRSFGDAFLPPPDTGELGQYYYRPFVTLSYMLDVGLFGAEHFYGHHLHVMVFHALATFGVGLLARRLLPAGRIGRFGAFAAAALFAVHPVHVDSVAQISGRCDPMAGAFMVWSLLALLRARERPDAGWLPWLLGAAAFLAALFSKEVGAATPVLGALLLWRSPGAAAAWRRFAVSFGAAAVVYAVLRALAPLDETPLREQSIVDAAARVLRALAYHVEMVTLPSRQAAFVPLSATPPWWVGLVAALGLAAAGVGVWRCRAAPAMLRLAWVWFVVTLAPALALLLVVASEQPVAERYLYVPSVGLALAFGWLAARLAQLPHGAKPAAIAVVALVCCAAVATASRARIYADEVAFWTDTAAKAPDAGLPQYELGLTLRRAGRLDEAMQRLETALARYDDAEGRSLAHNTIGTIHLERREWDEAEARFRAAIAERPRYATPWFNLAAVYGMRADSRRGPGNAPDRADLERCVEALGEAVELRPGYDKARAQLARQTLQLAKVYLVQGRRADYERLRTRAEAAARWLVQRDPSGPLGAHGRAVLAEIAELPR